MFPCYFNAPLVSAVRTPLHSLLVNGCNSENHGQASLVFHPAISARSTWFTAAGTQKQLQGGVGYLLNFSISQLLSPYAVRPQCNSHSCSSKPHYIGYFVKLGLLCFNCELPSQVSRAAVHHD